MPRALASEPGFAPTDLQGCALGLRNLLVGGGWAPLVGVNHGGTIQIRPQAMELGEMQSRRAVPSDHALCVFVFVYLCLCVCAFVAGRCNLSGRCPPAMPCVGGGVYLGGVDLRHDDPHPPHSHTPRSAWTPLLCSMAQCCAWWECAVDTVFIITS